MSEAQPVPSASRGRGSARAGRGGIASRGGGRYSSRQSNGEKATAAPSTSLDDQGELGQLKKHYMSQLDTLKELFPDWTDDDLVFALQETDGDLQSTIERITEGNVTRFADVKKKTKEKKSKDSSFASSDPQATSGRGRGGRGGFEGARGGRGRGSERGRGGSRGGRGGAAAASGGRTVVPATATTDAITWDAPVEKATISGTWDQPSSNTVGDGASEGQWGSVVAPDVTPATTSEGQKSSLIPEGATKSWASMLAQSKPIPAIPKSVAAAVPDSEPTIQPEVSTSQEATSEEVTEHDPLEPPSVPESFTSEEPKADHGDPNTAQGALDVGPGRDRLTEDNLEHLPDVSVPAATETAASTIDAASAIGSVTPFGSSQQPPKSRPPMGGYATTAWKATGTPGRSASFQRMMEQREAVVMPSNHAVDRAAVQFGSMGLNGESNPLDVDEDREEPETRAQPPQQSPPSQPRASLPPVPQPQPSVPEPPMQDSIPTPKAAPGFPMPSQTLPNPHLTQTPLQAPLANPSAGQTSSQGGPSYGQYGRYGASLSQEPAATLQKPYDPFSQQLNYPQTQHETQGTFAGQSQPPSQLQQPGQSSLAGFSQGQSDYSAQYGGDQHRSSYQNYYGSTFGQQGNTSQQENVPPQRSTSGFGANESGYGSSQATQPQSRFGETHTSGNNTPSQAAVSQPPAGAQSQQGQQMQQQPPGQTGHGGGYPYGNPYYSGSYYGTYMNQYPNYNYNQPGYGAPFGGKGGMYGQPHHGYAMSPQGSYDHSATPGTSSALGSSSGPGRDSGFSGGLGEYARSGSTQPSQGQQQTAAYGSFPGDQPDNFGRSSSNLMNQYGQQQNEASLKPFHDAKSGTSPSLGQPGRAGSAANSSGYTSNPSNFAPPQSQQGFGGYPSHLNQLHSNQGSQYGSLGGHGGAHGANAQSHQGGGYSNYGGGFSNSYGNYGRGGWGGNYGH